MAQPITVVDSFTDRPFTGNPAGVCVLTAPTTTAWMQAVAAELNLADTAFVIPHHDGDGDGEGDHDLRWFTPTVEVDLCGHATLASAHVLGGSGRFHTRSGLLVTRPGAEPGTIEMDFPANPPTPVDDDGTGSADWANALALPAAAVLRTWATATGWALVELASAADVRAAVPDPTAILALGGVAVVVAPGDVDGVDSVCRFFGPGLGVLEDPVTGSAHCIIAPWLAPRTGRTSFLGRQVSTRGGTVGMRLTNDRVVLTGHALTVWQGTLRHDPPPA
jgi:PhzF family phenazine biosynthesis protein